MSGSKIFVLLLFLTCCSAYNIDVRTNNVFVRQGKEGSMFGFSLTLNKGRAFGLLGVFVGAPLGKERNDKNGILLLCGVDETDCEHIQIDTFSSEDYEFREKQWMGATVYSNRDGHVVVCAPRYSEFEVETKKYYMIGECVVVQDSIERLRLYPCTRRVPGHDLSTRDQNGFCQAGFSAILRKNMNTVVMGAVMGKDQLGTVFQQTSSTSKKFSVASSDQTGGGFYLGYAVTYGSFYTKNTEDIAASAPRADFSGKVNMYTAVDLTFIESISPPDKVKQKQEYIYFGASVCAVDVNDDGYSDLIVGAPFYSDKGGDEGRVYVYISSETQSTGGRRVLRLSSGEKLADPGLRGSNNKGARFGWSIAKAGDLNNDEIEDFIVGAPQDLPDLDNDGVGNGAIYIYHGNRKGIFENYQQKITAETLKNVYPKAGEFFKQFGYAVAGNLDTNKDEYPDIAVGAWQSDSIVLLRARPVMDIKAVMTLSSEEIPVDNFTSKCVHDSSKQCLDVMVCFSYIGKSVFGPQEIQYTFGLDAETTARSFKRVFLLENGKKVYEKTARFNLTDKNDTKCLNFSQVRVEDKNRLTAALSRGTTEIVFNLKYELVSPPNCNTDTLCPVLDQSKDPSVSEKATLVLNCSDNTCDYDLNVAIKLDKTEVVIGQTRVVIATIELGNTDEVSYNPEIEIFHDPSIQYEKITIVTKSFKVNKQQVVAENVTISERFRVQGPLDRNEKVIIQLQYSTLNVLGNKQKLYINVKATATAGQEKDNKDNNATASISVKREVLMEITGTSNPKGLSYPAKAPTLNIQNNNFSAVNVSSIGPLVTVTFELTNQGKSDLQSIQLTITYPFKKHQPKEYDYIVYPISIQEKGSGLCNKEGVLNPANLTLLRDENSRQKRAAQELTPRTTSSHSFVCNVNELKADDRFIVVFEFHLWTATLAEFYSKDLLVTIQANAVYEDPLSTEEDPRTTKFGSVDIQVAPQNPPGKDKSTPVWVIIVAVLGGILLLALAILALFKLGFFKRNRPPKDISSPQTEDAPPPTVP